MSSNGASKQKIDNIFLTGFMGAGKSTIGRMLADKLDWPFVDTDQMIEQHAGISINEIFASKGERYFRILEAQAVQSVCKGQRQVVALGGGAVCHPAHLKLVKSTGHMIYLQASPETLNERTKDTPRPLLKKYSPSARLHYIHRLLEARQPYYAQAHLTLQADRKTPDQLCIEITHLLEKRSQK